MPTSINPSITITGREDLSEYTSFFITKFQENMTGEAPLVIDCVIHETHSGFPGKEDEVIFSHSHTQSNVSSLTLHLYQPDLIDTPALALQGWLDLELARQIIKHRFEGSPFNFKRDILPLINASGMAVQVMRYLVFHLETSLQQAIAAKMVLDMSHDQSLFYYFYTRTNPSEDDKVSYENLVPHHWTRAIFLCKKLRDHTAVALLARQGIFLELKSFWWTCHDYFLPEDKQLMEKLADISHQYEKMPFSEQLVTMFKTVKSHLLN